MLVQGGRDAVGAAYSLHSTLIVLHRIDGEQKAGHAEDTRLRKVEGQTRARTGAGERGRKG